MAEWTDNSSYRQGERAKKEPTCWSLRLPRGEYSDVRIDVHRVYGAEDSNWFTSCTAICFGPRELDSSTADGAKREALHIIHKIISDMMQAVATQRLKDR